MKTVKNLNGQMRQLTEASALTTAPLIFTILEGNSGFDFDEEERGQVRNALS